MTLPAKIIITTTIFIFMIYISIQILGYICLAVISYYGIKHFINKVLSLKK
jgi:hypothetical protein